MDNKPGHRATKSASHLVIQSWTPAQKLHSELFSSGEHKTQSGWEAVTIKKRILPPGIFNWLPAEAAALQEEAALMAVREALQAIPEPHHITHYLESYRHTDVTDGMEYMYYITRFEGSIDLHVHIPALHDAWQSSGNSWKLVHAVKHCFKQILQGLKVLHDCGWAHMDLKPSKVQVRMGSDGATPHCTIVDLGASVGEDYPYPELLTLSHAAPEDLQRTMLLQLPERALFKPRDMWSLGCLLVHILTNASPFVQPQYIGSEYWSELDRSPEHEMRKIKATYAFVRSKHAAWERDFDAGHGIPSGAAVLARLIPDKQQHRVVARLLRSLLHPDPACRPSVDEVLNNDFLHGI